MLKGILVILAVIIVVVLVLASMQPNEFKLSRSAVVKAPADKIFPEINDLKAFDKWNPFIEADPNVKVTYAGPESGVGMSSSWNGNNQIGEGMDTIIDSKANQSVVMRLDFVRPMKNTAQVTFTLQPQAQGTLVTWDMTGKNNFVGKLFHLCINMDKMVGGQFEHGLNNLKAKVETQKK